MNDLVANVTLSVSEEKQNLRWHLQSMVVDPEIRQLRSFVVLAEELNFTRAAQRVYLTQQALSAQIRRLERLIGAELLTRTTRQVGLTEAGEALLPHARAVLAAVEQARTDVRRVARDPARLRLGLTPGAAAELTTPILAEFAAMKPAIELEVREFSFRDPSAGLRAGAVDTAFVRVPLGTTGLQHVPLFTEPRVVALSASHALAHAPSVTLDDIRDEPLIATKTTDSVWNDFWLAMDCRDEADQPTVVTSVGSLEEELTILSTGRAVSITAWSASRHFPRPGIVFRPITDIPGSTLAVAWRESTYPEPVRLFVETALAVRDREVELVAWLSSGAAALG